MSRSINKVELLGHVANDPDVRVIGSGAKVAQFRIATSEGGFKKSDGTDVPEVTTWHSIVAWRGLAELAQKAVRKGMRVLVHGKITEREYEAKDGTKRRVTEILADDLTPFDEVKRSSANSQSNNAPQFNNQNNDGGYPF